MAVSGDGDRWALINCAPEVLSQIRVTHELHPRNGLRGSPIDSVLLTNGDIDHVAGLLSLREGQPFRLLATAAILDVLRASSAFDVLGEGTVSRCAVELGARFDLVEGVAATIFPVPGKVALYLEAREQTATGTLDTEIEGEQTIGIELTAGGKRALFIPGCAAITPALAARIEGADVLLFDGTLWLDDEMIREGVGTKTGRRMGHMSMYGVEGSIAQLARLEIGRRIFVHINNTNPVLIEGSEERLSAERAGWEIAEDSMEITL